MKTLFVYDDFTPTANREQASLFSTFLEITFLTFVHLILGYKGFGLLTHAPVSKIKLAQILTLSQFYTSLLALS